MIVKEWHKGSFGETGPAADLGKEGAERLDGWQAWALKQWAGFANHISLSLSFFSANHISNEQ